MNIIETLTSILTEGEAIIRLPQPGIRQTKWKKWSKNVADIISNHPELNLNSMSLSFKSLNTDLQIIRENISTFKQKQDDVYTDSRQQTTLENQQDNVSSSTKNGQINVFISYKNEDTALAQVVKNQLTSLNFDRVKVFLAYDDIRAGDRWKEQLFRELRKSDWLIMIHTDPDYDWEWPNREAVMFETMHMNLNRGDRRLCCLHATDAYPKTLNEFQHYKVEPIEDKNSATKLSAADIEALYKKSRVFQFLENFISYPDNNPIVSDKSLAQPHLIKAAKEIIHGFIHTQNDKVIGYRYYPPRLEIVLPPPDTPKDAPVISDSTSVTLGNKSRLIFNNEDSTFTWSDFRQERIDETENNTTPRWLLELEDRIKIAAQGSKIPEPSFAVLYSKHLNRFMRPILTRQEIFSSNKRKFYVLLVEQPLMDFSGHREMGLLLAVLIFAMRFRFDYLAPLFQAIVNIVRIEDYDKFIQEKMAMVTSIESEAEQHRLATPDKIVPVFQQSVQNEIRGLFNTWYGIREKLWEMFENTPTTLLEMDIHKKQIIEVHRTLYEMNTTFLKHSTERYTELLNQELTINNYTDGFSSTDTHPDKLVPTRKAKTSKRKPNREATKKTTKKVSKKKATTRHKKVS
jgi:hypothetical protein